METIQMYRRRYIPDEKILLKDDVILSKSDNVIVTTWDVLHPRDDIDHGVSAYFLKEGFKVSKIFDKNNTFVYWYCDIIDVTTEDNDTTYVFHDLLTDVIIYPDGHAEVVDLDEISDALEQNLLPPSLIALSLRRTNALLQIIYGGKFDTLTKYIEEAMR